MFRDNRFLRCRDGAIAPVTAGAILVLLTIVGGSIDYARSYLAQSRLQKSLDAAVLAAASSSTGDPIGIARKYFQANFLDSHTTGVVPNFSMSADGTIVGNISTSIETSILKIAHLDSIPLVANASAVTPSINLDVEFTPLSAQGAFAKDIFVFTRDRDGKITKIEKVLSYDYDGKTSWTTPSINQVTSKSNLTNGTSFGVMMRVFEDLTYLGRRDVSSKDYYSDDPAPRIKTSGSCETGQAHNWEDGGDSNYADFVYLMRCYKKQNGASVRLTN